MALNMLKPQKENAYERMWRENPEQFDPSDRAMDKLRIIRSYQLIDDLNVKKTADIGCGFGSIAQYLLNKGATVDGVEVSDFALKRLSQLEGFTPIKKALPHTHLNDDSYDLVVCTDVIAELDQKNIRLALSELSRLLKKQGAALISTPIDIYSEDALKRFLQLIETEFEVIKYTASYHYYFIRLLNLLKKPSIYWHSSKNNQFYQEQLKAGSLFFKWNATPPLSWMWRGVDVFFSPLRKWTKKNCTLCKFFEKVSHFLKSERGISHIILLVKRRPIQTFENETPLPKRAPFSKEVKWE